MSRGFAAHGLSGRIPMVTRFQRYITIWFRFLGLRKASALGYLKSQLRR
jgi:hypothetical protein